MSDIAEPPTRADAAPREERLLVPAHAPARPRGQRRWSLVLKLTLAFAATFAALEAALLISSHIYWRRVLQTQIKAHLTEVASSRRDAVDAGVKLLKQQVSFQAQRADFRRFLATTPGAAPVEADRVNSQKRLEQIVDRQTVLAAHLVDLNGKIVLSSDPTKIGTSVKKENSFTLGLAEPYVGWPNYIYGVHMMNISAPVGTAKSPAGLLLMMVAPEQIAAPLRATAGLGRTGEVMLLVRHGDQLRYLLPPRAQAALKETPIADIPALTALVSGSGSFLEMPDYRGQPVLAASSRTGYRDWTVVAKTDAEEAYAPIAQALHTGLLYGALVAAAGTLAVHAIARRITRPLRRVSEAAARIASGDYSAEVAVTSRDELGLLSDSFNEMTHAIRARVAERDAAETALREADRRKDNFLAILGHELRNPVGAITAGMRMLKETDGEATNPGVREVIERQTGNLTRLVDDLLDVARISTGRIELRRAPVRVHDLINHAVETVKSAIEARHHRLKIELLEGPPLWANVDATRLEQVLANLLANAAKYTQNGGRISISERHENDEAVIVVCDNGIGMTPESLNKIFKLFTQVESSLHQRTGGLGVGLSLSRELVELHGGELTAYSPGRGCGSEFTLRLPTIAPPSERAPELAAPAPAPIGRRRILLVDDNEDTARLLSGLLARRGHEICVAYDARAALEAVQSFAPEVFLLDIGLPEMDGYELARRFRAQGAHHQLFIAISGYAQEGDRASAHQAGFDYHLAKPVDIDELNALILA
jgi:signal transduction histidine kinase